MTAARLLHSKGYEGLTVEELTREARIGRTTFYKHFKNKADLLMAMLEDVASKVEAVIVPVHGLQGKAHIKTEVVENMGRILDIFESSLPLFRLFFSGGRATAGLEDKALYTLEKRLLSIIEEALKYGIQMRLIRKIDIKVSALAIWGSFLKAILQPLARGTIEVTEARRRVPLLVDYHVSGLVGA